MDKSTDGRSCFWREKELNSHIYDNHPELDLKKIKTRIHCVMM